MKEFLHHPPKISTHLHILIKVYDFFLLWIWSLTQQNMRSRFAIISSKPTYPPKKKPLEVGTYKISFQKPYKNLRIDGWTKEWVNGTLQVVLTLNHERWGWCYEPHRSKVKRCEHGQLIQNKSNNTRLCLMHKSGMRHCSNSWSTT